MMLLICFLNIAVGRGCAWEEVWGHTLPISFWALPFGFCYSPVSKPAGLRTVWERRMISWSILLCPLAPSLTRLQMHGNVCTFWHELQGLNLMCPTRGKDPYPLSHPSLQPQFCCIITLFIIPHILYIFRIWVIHGLCPASSLAIFYTINVSQKNAWERFQSGNETSKTVRQNVPFVYMSWLTQVSLLQ